jgi:hypothetical protein
MSAKAIAVLMAIIAIFTSGYIVGHKMADDDFEKYKVNQGQATIDAEKSVVEKQQKQSIITGEVSHDYESKISAIDALYNSVLGSTGTASHTANIPSSTGGRNGAAGGDGLSCGSRSALINLAKKADIQTQRLIACQQWITEQSAQ